MLRVGKVGNRRPRAPLQGRRSRASRFLEGPLGETPGAPTVSMQLQSSAQQAKHSPALGFNNVFHLIDRACLLAAYHQTRKSSAPGMDQVTAKPYAEHLDAHLRALHERRRDHRYVAPPVERVWSEKEEGKKRPRGTPCFEDKMVQRAVVMILAASFEPDFHAFSHGFRKGHRQHQALHELREPCRKLHLTWRVEEMSVDVSTPSTGAIYGRLGSRGCKMGE